MLVNGASQGNYNRSRAITYSQLLNSSLDYTQAYNTTDSNTNDALCTTTNPSHNTNIDININININIDINMAKQSKHHNQSAQPVLRGFMEPTAGVTHHEDI
jgi:hypothetical protein